MCVLGLNCVQIFAASRTAARQAPLSRIFPRQEYSSGLPFSSPGIVLIPEGSEQPCLMYPALADGFFTTRATWKAHTVWNRQLQRNGSCSQPGEHSEHPIKWTQGIPLETITSFTLESQIFSPWHPRLL